MKPAPIPANEAERLAALRRYELLDTPPEAEFDEVARLAAHVLGTPIALVSLIDTDRQWFKARYGLEAPQTPRDVSFCGHVVADGTTLLVPDARADARFVDNPLVTGEPRVGFYVGAPLRTPDGYLLGTLCAIDHAPRNVSAEQIELLQLLGRQVVTTLEGRRRAKEASAYRQLLDSGLACSAGLDGRFKTLSPAWAELLGFSIDELVGRPLIELVHADDVEQTRAQLRSLEKDGRFVAFQNRFVHRRGATRWLLWHAVLDRSDGSMHASAVDLTPLKLGELSLRESEARHRTLVDHLTDGVVTIDQRGIIRQVNPATRDIFGYSDSELLGQNVSILTPPPTRDRHDGYLQRYLAGGTPRIVGSRRELVGQRKDGTPVPLELAVNEIVLQDEKFFVGVVRDITMRQKNAAQLHAVLGMQRAILDGASYGIVSSDVDGVIRSFNRAAERLLGYSAEELVGKLTPAVFCLQSEVEQRARELSVELGRQLSPGFEVLVAKARSGAVDENEWTGVRKDGTTVPVLLSVSALRDAAGEVNGFLGIAADLTERKAVQKLQTEFVSTVSHELRTPLTAIRGSLGLLAGGAMGVLPARARELVELALSNCERLVRLVNDILDIERLHGGQIQLSLRDVDLRDVLSAAVEANRPYGQPFGVELVLQCPAVPVIACVDVDRFMQVLANLLSNAVKFSPPKARVDVALEVAGREAVVSVRDRGRGIPEAFRAQVFQRFAQADTSDARTRGGTGLGLAISKRLVEQMQGTLSFTNPVEGGTQFEVRTPVVATPSAAKGGQATP